MSCGGNCKCVGNCRCGNSAEYDFSQKSAESFAANPQGRPKCVKCNHRYGQGTCAACGNILCERCHGDGEWCKSCPPKCDWCNTPAHSCPDSPSCDNSLCDECCKDYEAESFSAKEGRIAMGVETFEAFKYGENNKYWKMRKNAYLRNNKRINSYEEKDWEKIFKNGIAPQNDEEMVEWITNHQLTDDNLKYGMSRANTLSRINAVLSSYFDERMYFRPYGAESFSADGEDEEKRFFQFKEDGEIEYLVFGKGRAAKRKTHLMRFSKLHGDEPFSMYDKYRGTPNGGAVCGVTNRAGIHTFQWDETLTPDAVNCIRCSKYVQYLRDNNLLFTEEKTAESFESEYYGADNQIRDYRNIGIGAALVAGLVYWFKR